MAGPTVLVLTGFENSTWSGASTGSAGRGRALILAAFVPLAVRQYKRAASR